MTRLFLSAINRLAGPGRRWCSAAHLQRAVSACERLFLAIEVFELEPRTLYPPPHFYTLVGKYGESWGIVRQDCDSGKEYHPSECSQIRELAIATGREGA